MLLVCLLTLAGIVLAISPPSICTVAPTSLGQADIRWGPTVPDDKRTFHTLPAPIPPDFLAPPSEGTPQTAPVMTSMLLNELSHRGVGAQLVVMLLEGTESFDWRHLTQGNGSASSGFLKHCLHMSAVASPALEARIPVWQRYLDFVHSMNDTHVLLHIPVDPEYDPNALVERAFVAVSSDCLVVSGASTHQDSASKFAFNVTVTFERKEDRAIPLWLEEIFILGSSLGSLILGLVWPSIGMVGMGWFGRTLFALDECRYQGDDSPFALKAEHSIRSVFINPLGTALSNEPYAVALGAVAFNVIAIVIVAVYHWSVAHIVRILKMGKRPGSLHEAQGSVRFPSATYIVALTLAMPTIGVCVLIQGGGAGNDRKEDILILSVACVVLLGILVAVYWNAYRFITNFSSVFFPMEDEDVNADIPPSTVTSSSCGVWWRVHPLRWVFASSGQWDDDLLFTLQGSEDKEAKQVRTLRNTQQLLGVGDNHTVSTGGRHHVDHRLDSQTRFHLRYGSLFSAYRPSCRLFAVIELVALCIMAVLWGVRETRCKTTNLLATITMTVVFAARAALRPYTTPYRNVVAALSSMFYVASGLFVVCFHFAGNRYPASRWGSAPLRVSGEIVVSLVAFFETLVICTKHVQYRVRKASVWIRNTSIKQAHSVEPSQISGGGSPLLVPLDTVATSPRQQQFEEGRSNGPRVFVRQNVTLDLWFSEQGE